MNVHKKFVDVL